MKKMTFFAVMLMVAAALTSCGANKQVAQNGYQQPPYYQQPYAQQNPYQQQPQQQPVYNQPTKRVTGPEAKVREWESKGMELAGNSGLFDMYTVAEQVYNKLAANRDKYIILSGTFTHQTESGAKSLAQTVAITDYAKSAGSAVKGRFEREVSSISDLDKIVEAYSGIIQKKISSYMNEELAVRKKTDKGVTVEVWWSLDESKVKQLRQQAMEQALQETAVEQIVGNAIRDYVNEAVPGNFEE